MFSGKRMAEARERRGLTGKELALLIDGTQSQIARYEKGVRIPRSDTLARICQALQVSADYLLELTEEKQGHIAELSDGERTLIKAAEKGLDIHTLQWLVSFFSKGMD